MKYAQHTFNGLSEKDCLSKDTLRKVQNLYVVYVLMTINWQDMHITCTIVTSSSFQLNKRKNVPKRIFRIQVLSKN